MKIKNMAKILILISSIFTMPVFALSALTDQEMSEVEGQALFNLSYLGPTEDVDPTTVGVQTNAGNIGFYTLSMEAEVALNANARSMKLGCGGVNGAGACDIDIEKFSLGCIANASGTCITLPPTGIQKTGVNNVNSDAGQQLMRDFVLKNPFYQFAIKNPETAATREVVGIRIGAANVKGPMSFDGINTFSGYMTGKTNLEMIGANNVAATCQYPKKCVAFGADTTGMLNDGASSWGSPSTSCGVLCTRGGKGNPSGGWMGLGDDMVLDIGIAKIRLQEALVGYGTVNRNNLDVLLNGTRETQADILGANLGGVVNSIVYGNTDGSTTVGANPLTLDDSDAGALVSVFGAALLPALRGTMADQIKRQLVDGLRVYNPNQTTNATIANSKSDAQIHTDLNSYVMPFNVANLHQVEVDSTTFGLALSKQDLQYPGFAAAVNRGWSMYLPDAFTLNISRPTTEFVSSITGSSAARDGNIVGLEAPFRNCWGNAHFC